MKTSQHFEGHTATSFLVNDKEGCSRSSEILGHFYLLVIVYGQP